jgi:hypothetical protein
MNDVARRSLVWPAFVGMCLLIAGCIAIPLPRYEVPKPPVPVATSADSAARGRAVAFTACARCHAGPDTGALSGKRLPEIPAALAKVRTRQSDGGPRPRDRLVHGCRTGHVHANGGQTGWPFGLPVGSAVPAALRRRRGGADRLPAVGRRRRPFGRPSGSADRVGDRGRILGQDGRQAARDACWPGRGPFHQRHDRLRPIRCSGVSAVLHAPLGRLRKAR